MKRVGNAKETMAGHRLYVPPILFKFKLPPNVDGKFYISLTRPQLGWYILNELKWVRNWKVGMSGIFDS